MVALRRFIVLSMSICACGCTHIALRNNTVNQMQTVHDLQQQQVLDNLAMFAANPDAYPYFSLPTTGTCAITDAGSLTESTTWARSGKALILSSVGVDPSVSRTAAETWTLSPINDSVKLTLMRCVYQRAVSSCLGTKPSCSCPQCDALFQSFYQAPKQSLSPLCECECAAPTIKKTFSDVKNPHHQAQIAFYTSTSCGVVASRLVVVLTAATPSVSFPVLVGNPPNQSKVGELITDAHGDGTLIVSLSPDDATILAGTKAVSIDQWQAQQLESFAGTQPSTGASPSASTPPPQLLHVPGIITPYCIENSHCWFCVGPKKAVPKECGCGFVGHYCDTWVWVPPAGRDELSKLTILIVDIAFYDPPQPPAAPMVSFTISANGTTPGGSVSVPIGTSALAVNLAPYNAKLIRFLARRGLSEYSLIDYWSRGIAGPGMSKDDVDRVDIMLKDIGINWTNLVSARLTERQIPNAGLSQLPDPSTPLQLALTKDITPEQLAAAWENHATIENISYEDEIALIDYYRLQGCNAVTRLGSDYVDRIAYHLLDLIGREDCCLTAARTRAAEDAKQRFADLDLSNSSVTPRTPSPAAFGLPTSVAPQLQNILSAPSIR